MAFVLKDRVRETTTTTGTGTVTLLGAVSGYHGFLAVGDGNTTHYCITGGAEWEVGLGTYASGTLTLTRDVVLDSSNAGALVNFGAGTKDVFCTAAAVEFNFMAKTNVGQTFSGNQVFTGNVQIQSGLAVLSTIQTSLDDSATAPAQFVVTGGTNPFKQLLIGFNTTLNYGSIQATQLFDTDKPLLLNPTGGAVGLGSTTPAAKLSVNGGAHIGGDTDPGDNNLLVDGTIAGTDTTQSTSTTTGAVKTAGGLGVAKNVWIGGTVNVSGHATLEGVTSTGATGTGKFVFDTAPTFVTSITTPKVIFGATAPATALDYQNSNVRVVNNGANATIAPAAHNFGMILITETQTVATTAIYFTSFHTATLISTDGTTWVASTTTPAAGKFSVAWDGTQYSVYNNQGAQCTFRSLIMTAI
jgi:hypothetical protein